MFDRMTSRSEAAAEAYINGMSRARNLVTHRQSALSTDKFSTALIALLNTFQHATHDGSSLTQSKALTFLNDPSIDCTYVKMKYSNCFLRFDNCHVIWNHGCDHTSMFDKKHVELVLSFISKCSIIPESIHTISRSDSQFVHQIQVKTINYQGTVYFSGQCNQYTFTLNSIVVCLQPTAGHTPEDDAANNTLTHSILLSQQEETIHELVDEVNNKKRKRGTSIADMTPKKKRMMEKLVAIHNEQFGENAKATSERKQWIMDHVFDAVGNCDYTDEQMKVSFALTI